MVNTIYPKNLNEQILLHVKMLLFTALEDYFARFHVKRQPCAPPSFWCMCTTNYSPNKNASLGGKVKRRFDYDNQPL